MGVELKLLPVNESNCHCHMILELPDTCRKLFNILEMELEKYTNTEKYLEYLVVGDIQTGVIKSIASYFAEGVKDEEGLAGEDQYGDVTRDKYDKPLHWMTVRKLLQIKDENEDAFVHIKTFATWAYLEHLPPETRVVLFWC